MRLNPDLSVNVNDLDEFQEIIQFRFNDTRYLVQALLHGSLFSGNKDKLNAFKKVNGLENKDYEKLEYLGDSVLGLIVAEYAYHSEEIDEYASSNGLTIEGVSTKIREVLASNKNLKPVAQKIKLSRFVLSEELVNIDGKLSDIIEALIGAIYLDGGHSRKDSNSNNNYSIAKDFVYRFFDIDAALGKIPISNPKGRIQELFHKTGAGNPCYKLTAEEGPDHDKNYTVGLYMDEELLATGEGNSKRSAEKAAAKNYLKSIDESTDTPEIMNS